MKYSRAVVVALAALFVLSSIGCKKAEDKKDDTPNKPSTTATDKPGATATDKPGTATTTTTTKPGDSTTGANPTPPAPVPTPKLGKSFTGAELKTLVDAVCACKDAPCLKSATAAIGARMKSALQGVNPAEKGKWMMNFQRTHRTEFARGDNCRRKVIGVKPLDLAVIKKQLAEYGTKMCACKEMTCARKVNRDLSMWALGYFKDKEKPNKAMQDKLKQANKKYTDCFKSLYTKAAKKTPPTVKPPANK